MRAETGVGGGTTAHDRSRQVDLPTSNIPESDLLIFGQGNGKLDPAISHFSLPAGFACPGALQCLSRAVEQEDGRYKVVDGTGVQFRCFSASEEARYPNVRAIRWHNWDMLRKYGTGRTDADKARSMAALILASLPVRDRVLDMSVDGRAFKAIVRLHVAGDFFSQAYMDAWLLVCRTRPDLLFYAYSKSLPMWVSRLDQLPENFVLTASEGGKWDHLIGQHGLRSARVVYSEDAAARLGLPIDHDDSHAMRRGPSFALLLHGPQQKGTPAAKAWAAIQAAGGGHGKANARRRREAARRVPLPLAG